jgi:hypothetical protein
VPGSTVLASQSVPEASVPGVAAFLSIGFPTPASVVAGTQYAIVAYSATTTPNIYGWSESSTANPYAGGELLFTTTSPPSGSWFSATTEDLAFKTYVVVPTPVATPVATPSNAFTIGGLKGKSLTLNVSSMGTAEVTDAGASGASAVAAAKRLLKTSTATGGPGPVQITLKLTKAAKQKLRKKGKVRVNARITFTPSGGTANSQSRKLKIKKG